MDAPSPAWPRLPYALGLVTLALVWLAMLLFGTGPLDQQLSRMFYAGGSPLLVRAAKLVTRVGEPTIMVSIGLIVAACLALRQRARLALTLTLVFLLGRVLVEMQKYGIARVRPTLEPQLVPAKTFSFVSGHAANSMIVLLALAVTVIPEGRWRLAAIVAALLGSLAVGASRLMLGVHWPSDVIGGWAFGVFWTFVALRPTERLLAVRFRR